MVVRPVSTDLVRTTRDLGAPGPVRLRLVEDAFGWERALVAPVAVPDDARVVEIGGPAAWADLCREYPLEVTASRRHDWYRATGRGDGRWLQPDWTSVAAEVDAVHVTVAGYLTTAGRAVPVEDGVMTVLAGWDPDATSRLRDVVAIGPAHEWRLDRDTHEWHPVGDRGPHMA